MVSRFFIERLLLLLIGSYLSIYTFRILQNECNLFQQGQSIPIGPSTGLELNDWLEAHNKPKLDISTLTEHELSHLQNVIIPEAEAVVETVHRPVTGTECFKDIRGHKKIINTLSKFIKSEHKPNGIILHGPPGTGKTMLVRCIAKESNLCLLKIESSSVENKLFGESTKSIRGAFSLAAKISPCLLFIDELDGIAGNRSILDQSHVTSMKTELMSCMDGYHGVYNDVILIGSTNILSHIDKAVQRRMRMHIKVDTPTKEDLTDFFKSYFGNTEKDEVMDKLVLLVFDKKLTFSDINQMICMCQIENDIVDSLGLMDTLKWHFS